MSSQVYAMSETQLNLLKAICTFPAEDTPRLVYADWLEEHGNAARAEFVRVQVERAKPCRLGRSDAYHVDDVCEACDPLWRRERELFTASHARSWGLGDGWRHTVHPDTMDPGYGASVPAALFSRGFVSVLTLTAVDWLVHADAVCWHPSQTVARIVTPPFWEQACARKNRLVRDKIDDVWRRVMARTAASPRPFVPTAQPVTGVTLTTIPDGGIRQGNIVEDKNGIRWEWSDGRWKWIKFTPQGWS